MLRKTLLATVCASLFLSSALPVTAAPSQQLQSEQGPSA